MPIKDLFWACPVCHQIESIDANGTCTSCRAEFSRARGARIRALTPDGTEELTPLEWLAHLPWPDLDGDGRSLPAGLEPPFRQPVLARTGQAHLPLLRGSELLGFVEKFGPPEEGELELTDSVVSFLPRRGKGWRWDLNLITAISPASASIQLKARDRPVVSLRFPAGSLRLWEQRLQYCVRQAYGRAGQGEIAEFQPHVRTR
jgi:hypothetical protein